MSNTQKAIRVSIIGLISMILGLVLIVVPYPINCHFFAICGAILLGLGLGVFVIGLANITD